MALRNAPARAGRPAGVRTAGPPLCALTADAQHGFSLVQHRTCTCAHRDPSTVCLHAYVRYSARRDPTDSRACLYKPQGPSFCELRTLPARAWATASHEDKGPGTDEGRQHMPQRCLSRRPSSRCRHARHRLQRNCMQAAPSNRWAGASLGAPAWAAWMRTTAPAALIPS